MGEPTLGHTQESGQYLTYTPFKTYYDGIMGIWEPSYDLSWLNRQTTNKLWESPLAEQHPVLKWTRRGS